MTDDELFDEDDMIDDVEFWNQIKEGL